MTTTPTTTKPDLYEYTRENAPENLVVNIGKSPILIGGSEHVTKDSARIDPGDRRMGDYYVEILNKSPDAVRGLVQVHKCPQDRLDKANEGRDRRTHARPPKWVEKARKQAEGKPEPEVFDKQKAAMVGIQRQKINEEVAERQAEAAANATVKDFSTGFADEL